MKRKMYMFSFKKISVVLSSLLLSSCLFKNESSLSLSDKNIPDLNISLTSGQDIVADRSLQLKFDSSHQISEMAIGNGTDCNFTSWQPFSSILPWNLPSLAEEQTIAVKARTIYGFESACVTKKIRLDKAGPVFPVPSLQLTANFTNSLTDSVGISWLNAVDAGIGLSHYEVSLGRSAGGTDVLSWTNIGTASTYQNSNLNLTNATSYFPSVRAVDKFGNVGPVLTGSSWTVDQNPPIAPSALSSDHTLSTLLQSPVLSWPAGQDPLSGINRYEIAVGTSPGATDVLAWQGVGTQLSKQFTGGTLRMPHGQVFYPSVRAIDNVGNISMPVQGTGWRVMESWRVQDGLQGAFGSYSFSRHLKMSDGRYLIYGYFDGVAGARSDFISRLKLDGTFDDSLARTAGADGFVYTSVKQSDGKIIIGGGFTTYNGISKNHIARINADGSLDSNFVAGAGFNDSVFALALQSDGKIIVGGIFTNFNDTPVGRVARLNPNGTLDTSFVTGLGFDYEVDKIVLQADGKILIGGRFHKFDGQPEKPLIRLNSDGSRDSSFSSGIDFFVLDIALHDGKILVGGGAGTVISGIARLNMDGSVDNKFNTSLNGWVSSIVLQNDGKILIGGAFSNVGGIARGGIARLNSEGLLDTTLDPGSGANQQIRTIFLQEDGKILAGGDFSMFNNQSARHIVRLNPNGSMDSNFAAHLGFNRPVLSIMAFSDGKIWVGSDSMAFNSRFDGTTGRLVARMTSAFKDDPTFTSKFATKNKKSTLPRFAVVQSDGKILLGGYFTEYDGTTQNNVVRLNDDGSRDDSFTIGAGFNDGVFAAVLRNDGKIILGGGFTAYKGMTQNRLIQLNSDGMKDVSFDIGSGFNGEISKIWLLPDGKVIVTGHFTSYNGVACGRILRINTNGSIDETFNQQGAGFNGGVRALYRLADGKLMVGGDFTSYNGIPAGRIARLDENGNFDAGFNVGSGFNDQVVTFTEYPGGKVFVGGDFLTLNGQSAPKIVLLNKDGSIDKAFKVVGSGFDSSASIYSIDVKDDGRILVSGSFKSVDGKAVLNTVLLGW